MKRLFCDKCQKEQTELAIIGICTDKTNRIFSINPHFVLQKEVCKSCLDGLINEIKQKFGE